jgi:hypothetical protein
LIQIATEEPSTPTDNLEPFATRAIGATEPNAGSVIGHFHLLQKSIVRVSSGLGPLTHNAEPDYRFRPKIGHMDTAVTIDDAEAYTKRGPSDARGAWYRIRISSGACARE